MGDMQKKPKSQGRADAASDTLAGRAAPMSDRDFKQFSEFIHAEVGIKLPPSKKTMLEARLQKRLRILGMTGYSQYCAYLFTEEGMTSELGSLINAVTTNTTDFFREPKHFDYLHGNVLPEWFSGKGSQRRLRVWSAGCSIGMEPYTLAMVFNEFAHSTPGFSFSMLATDISSQALEKAVFGVYEEDRVAPVPDAMKRKYLMRSKDRSKRLVRVVPEVRKQITFKRLNFMEPFAFPQPFDIIFCRNVIIYFDKPTQEVLFGKFCQQLAAGGHIFIGHSESLSGMELPLQQVAPTVYRKV